MKVMLSLNRYFVNVYGRCLLIVNEIVCLCARACKHACVRVCVCEVRTAAGSPTMLITQSPV